MSRGFASLRLPTKVGFFCDDLSFNNKCKSVKANELNQMTTKMKKKTRRRRSDDDKEEEEEEKDDHRCISFLLQSRPPSKLSELGVACGGSHETVEGGLGRGDGDFQMVNDHDWHAH